jgi:hypothetical protein
MKEIIHLQAKIARKVEKAISRLNKRMDVKKLEFFALYNKQVN